MNTHLVKVFGKVQGVYFRFTTKAIADQLGIKGLVKNIPDGSVYIEAQGEDFLINEFLIFCKAGPEKADVTGIEIEIVNKEKYKNFEILKR